MRASASASTSPALAPTRCAGYYAGFDRKTLYLGRMEDNWQQLATFDLTTRENKVELDTWNLLRVVVKGSRIRVWFNPLHDQTGPLLDCTDPGPPILSGRIACRVQDSSAWFDDLVVLPVETVGNPITVSFP